MQGDNLVALKALLPYYAGQVKCIYIDPPYNTGKYPRLRGDYTYVGPSYVVPGYAPGVRVGVGPVGVGVGPGYDAYAYDPY